MASYFLFLSFKGKLINYDVKFKEFFDTWLACEYMQNYNNNWEVLIFSINNS